ncbi:phage tail tape measure protein [Nocardia salmonicida]
MQTEKDLDFIQARMGTSDEMMKTMGNAAAAAFSNGWGEGVTANVETLALATQAGIFNGEETAAEMQPMLEKLTAMNDLLGGDMETSIAGVRALMLNGMAADGVEAMDLITRAMQGGADSGHDLMESVNQYSNGWKNAGFSAKFAFGMINQSIANGAPDSDRAGDALREFGRRMYEETDTIKETIGAINDEVEGLDLPVDDLFEALKKGGPEGEAAFDTVFDAIRRIEDPLKRNEVVMGLLGDTSGDFIDAFAKWDPSEAAASMDDFAGSTARAMDVMGDNGASALQASMNGISASADDVKLALGEAFGPTISKAAEWVSTHKPEIMAFFVGLADGALACLDGLITFASGSLRAFASLQEGIGDTVGAAITALGGFAEKIGGVIKHIPGMEDAGKAIESAGSAAATYGTAMNNAADGAKALADKLDGAKPVIQGIRDQVAEAGSTAVGAAEMTRLFGGAVNALPDGKSLVVEALTDDARARLTEFGFAVENLPDGTTQITANTTAGQTLIDQFIAHNTGRPIELTPKLTGEINANVANIESRWTRADGGVRVPSYADGKLPNQAIVQQGRGAGLVQWAEGETGGEAFIPLALSKRRRSLKILAETARRMGMAIVGKDDTGSAGRLDPLTAAALSMRNLLSFADGGVLDSITTLQQKVAPGLTLSSGHRDEPGSYHSTGQAGDYAGSQDDMLAWANWLADNRRAELAELIFHHPKFSGRQIKDGEFVDDSVFAGAGDHTDHVHAAGKTVLSQDVPKGSQPLSKKQERVDAIIAEGRRRGISDKGIKIALATAFAESGDDLTMYANESDPETLKFPHEALSTDGSSSGNFQQQDNGAWGSAADRMDPAKAAGMFFDKLDDFDYESMSLGEAAQQVQKSAFEDGSNFSAKSDLAEAAFAESEGRSKATADTSSSSTVSGQPVYVTNWPSSMGGSSSPSSSPASTETPATNPDGSTTLGSYKFSMFADGGVEDHSAQIAAGGDMRVWAEPETGGEAYIPLGAAKRGRSRAILADVARRFGLSLTPYAMGGFGGVGQDGDDGVHTGSWEVAQLGEQGDVPLSTPSRDVPLAVWASSAYRAAAFAAGAAGTLASGWSADGKFQGFDTSSNSLPDGWGDKLTEVQELLSRIAEAAEQGNPVDVEVAIDPGTRTAELNIQQRGV